MRKASADTSVNEVYFDDVAAATEYVGPLQPVATSE